MASKAYLTNNDDHNTAKLIISGFSETLRSWWDNCLNKDEREFLQTGTNDEGEQNEVHRIIYVITKHFVGDLRILCSTHFRSNPIGGSEPVPGCSFNSFYLIFIYLFFLSKVSRPEYLARPE